MPENQIVEQPKSTVLLMSFKELALVFLIGALVGVLTYAAYFLFKTYVFDPMLCGTSSSNIGRCENTPILSSGFATIVAAVVGAFLVIRQRIYRPLLVVLLVTASLWNIVMLFEGMWYISLLLMAGVFGVAYAAFSWLVQIRNFMVALVVSAVVFAVVRYILMS